jgi:hypothetical protein
MKCSPFQNERESPSGQLASKNDEGVDFDQGLVFDVYRVDMRWIMVVVVELDGNPEEARPPAYVV